MIFPRGRYLARGAPILAITSGPKMIEIFGKLEKLETQLLYKAIKISSKTVHNLSCNLSWLYGWDNKNQ